MFLKRFIKDVDGVSIYAIFSLALEWFNCLQNDRLQYITCLPLHFAQKLRRKNYIIQYKLRDKTAVFSLITCEGVG